MYKNATLHDILSEDLKPTEIRMKRGIKQGYTVSPKLFILVRVDFFRISGFRIFQDINDRYLNHLCFADDAVLISNDLRYDLN